MYSFVLVDNVLHPHYDIWLRFIELDCHFATIGNLIEFLRSFSFWLFVSCVDEILRVNSLANSFFYDCFKI